MGEEKVIYCQIVVGAPGSGKTTYCTSMKHFLEQIGRESLLINLDPANDAMKEIAAVSLTDLITVDDVMSDMQLGPNGGLIYCMDWLEEHIDLLKEYVWDALDRNPHCRYLLFDFPGQIELYTNCTSVRSILQTIHREWKFRPVVVHLTDSLLCKDPSHYISSLMVSLSVMMNLEMPHVNVLTKSDLLNPDELSLPIEAFEGVEYLNFVANQIDKEYHYIPSNTDGTLRDRSDNDDDDDGDDENDDHDDMYNSEECKIQHSYEDESVTIEPERRRIAHPIKVYDEDGNVTYLSDDDDDEFYDIPMQSYCIPHSGEDGGSNDNNGNAVDQQHENNSTIPKKNYELERYMRFHRQLNRSLCDIITDYDLISLTQLSVHDKYKMNDVLTLIDKANGYAFKEVDLTQMQFKHFTSAAQSTQQQIEEMTVVTPRSRPRQ